MILHGIHDVSNETGIHPSSLRRRESIGLIPLGRIVFGEPWMRVYSDADVERLQQAKRLMDQGYKLRWTFEKALEDLPAE